MTTLETIKQHTAKLTPSVDSHLRKALLEGFNDVKKLDLIYETLTKEYEATNWGDFKPVKPVSASSGELSIDRFIGRSVDGYRDGLLICWDTEDGTYTYNIYKDKLCLKQS